MDILPSATVSMTVVLAAAVVLAQLHGRRFARYFLQDYDIDEAAIWELLDELPTVGHI